MNSTIEKARTTAQRRSRTGLTWVDFLVIAAIVLTFAAIVSSTVGKARASHTGAIMPAIASEVGEAHMKDGLIKAQVHLTSGALSR